MSREELDAIERGPTPEELAEEIRLWTLYQQQQEDAREMKRHTARWHRHLSSETAA